MPSNPNPDDPNLDLWYSMGEVPAEYTKQFDKATFKGTSWDATWAKWKGTEMWGPYGKNWGLRDLRWGIIQTASKVDGITLECNFYYPGGAYEFGNDIKYRDSGDTYKRLFTDTLKKAMTMLGFASEIYLGKFDDDAYTGNERLSQAEIAAMAIAKIREATTYPEVEEMVARARRNAISPFYMGQVLQAENLRQLELTAADSTAQQEDRFGGGNETTEKTAASDDP